MTDNDVWRNRLTREQYAVMREKGTEAPFSGTFVDHHEDGVYRCAACGASLFSSAKKFDSGTGWPSFADVVEQGSVILREDDMHGMQRTEVVCASCGGHLGHVFDDGPVTLPGDVLATGKRYCINSICLAFSPNEQKEL